MRAHRHNRNRILIGGFTLIEVLLASVAGAMILAAVYTIFARAVHMRDDATDRVQQARLRARAAAMIRNDLRNGIVSGGLLAASLEGSPQGQASQFPGYLRFTTTTARATTDLPEDDVQEVEYYIATDPDSTNRSTGILTRTVDMNLLASVRNTTREDALLKDVESMEVSFYDGESKSWTDSWEVTDTDKTLPAAVRVRFQQIARSSRGDTHVPVEVLVPWSNQAWLP